MSWRNAALTFPASRQAFRPAARSNPPQIAPTPNSNEFQYNLFTPQVSVSYCPMFSALNRRTVESLKAQEQGVRFQMIATYTTLDRQRGGHGDSGGLVADAD
jgi:hypothetical protein